MLDGIEVGVFAYMYVAVCCSVLQWAIYIYMYTQWKATIFITCKPIYIYIAHCNTLQHTATHCNTLQHTATHCNTLQHTSHANPPIPILSRIMNRAPFHGTYIYIYIFCTLQNTEIHCKIHACKRTHFYTITHYEDNVFSQKIFFFFERI